mmetsp:Transcript_18825/g.59197  ORF Transcript_18825/g.59197 Transcript_18825/m.59197 type:complete len:241 (+) Transcript_18825:54-776(+)
MFSDLEFWWEADLAKSGRSTCKKCKQQIGKDEPRLGRTTHEDDHHGSNWGYFHPKCAVMAVRYWKDMPALDLGTLRGLDTLPAACQEEIRSACRGSDVGGKAKGKGKGNGNGSGNAAGVLKRPSEAVAADSAAKRRRSADPAASGPPADVVREMEALTAAKLKELLRLNDQVVTGTKAQLVARAADGKAFGALPRCPKCSGGRIRHEAGVYKCPGYMDDEEFMPCDYQSEAVDRLPWKGP